MKHDPTTTIFYQADRLAYQLADLLLAASNRCIDEGIEPADIRQALQDINFVVESAVYEAHLGLDGLLEQFEEQDRYVRTLDKGMLPF